MHAVIDAVCDALRIGRHRPKQRLSANWRGVGQQNPYNPETPSITWSERSSAILASLDQRDPRDRDHLDDVREGDCSMPRTFGISLLSLIAIGLINCPAAWAQAQPAPTAPAGTPAAGPATGRPRPPSPAPTTWSPPSLTAIRHEQGHQGRGDHLPQPLSRSPPTRTARPSIATRVDALVNTKLLTMFLARQKVPVPPEKVDEADLSSSSSSSRRRARPRHGPASHEHLDGRHPQGIRKPASLVRVPEVQGDRRDAAEVRGR